MLNTFIKMLFKLFVCSLTLTSLIAAQMLPVMPPDTVRNQGTISYPELVAMMAMQNRLPTANQEYSLLNLTGGRPVPTVPTPQNILVTVKPQEPSASDAIRKQLPTAVSAAVQAAVPSAVQAAVQAALPSAVKSVVQQTAPARPPPPAISPAALQSLVQSAVQAMLPSAVASAVKIATPRQPSQPVQQNPSAAGPTPLVNQTVASVADTPSTSSSQGLSNAANVLAMQSAMKPAVPSVAIPSSPSVSSSSNQGLTQADLMVAIKTAMQEAVQSVKQTSGTQAAAPAGTTQITQKQTSPQSKSVCLSVCLSLALSRSVCLSVCLSVSLSLSLGLYICLSVLKSCIL